MTAGKAYLIPPFKILLVLFSFLPLILAALAKPPVTGLPGVQSLGCEHAVAAAHRYEFYEALAVLAESNLEKFFLPQYRLAVHSQILKDGVQRIVPQSPWWIPEGQSLSYTTELMIQKPSEDEMTELMGFRNTHPSELSTEQLDKHLVLEKKLHLALFKGHLESLETYRRWAFESLPPLRAYQRVFENYVSASVWWNSYVSDYARTLAAIYEEQNSRANCPRELLWTHLDE